MNKENQSQLLAAGAAVIAVIAFGVCANKFGFFSLIPPKAV